MFAVLVSKWWRSSKSLRKSSIRLSVEQLAKMRCILLYEINWQRSGSPLILTAV
jgi:hypothetical protein